MHGQIIEVQDQAGRQRVNKIARTCVHSRRPGTAVECCMVHEHAKYMWITSSVDLRSVAGARPAAAPRALTNAKRGPMRLRTLQANSRRGDSAALATGAPRKSVTKRSFSCTSAGLRVASRGQPHSQAHEQLDIAST